MSIFSLRTKILSTLALMVVIVAIGAGSMYWYTYKIKAVFKEIIDQEITAYKAAQDMELALSNQKGFLTYYFIDEDPPPPRDS